MRTTNDIRNFGLTKLAQSSGAMPDPHMLGQIVSAPSRALDVASTGTFSAPTPQEAATMNSYVRSGIVGGLAGTAVSALFAILTKQPILPHLAVGAGAGLLSGITRQYDQNSDPPGLSPIYTVPSGLRLGGLTGALAGLPLGRLSGAGMLSGALSGALGGAAGGGAVSSFI